MDLDPCFVRGLQLLHSRAPESAEQLRALLEEVQTRGSRSGGGAKLSPANMSPRPTSNNSLKRPYDSKYKDEATSGENSKKYHLTETGRSYPASPTMSRDSDVSKRSDDSDLNDTAGLEMDLMSQLACVVCRNIGVTSGNQLQECSECGNLYHQECHSPPISEAERTDARAIWMCSKCCDTTTNTTAVTSGHSKHAAPTLSSSSSSSTFSHSASRSDRTTSESSVQRRDAKSSSSSFSTLRSGYGGSAISSSKSSSKSHSSGSSFSSSSGGRSMYGGGPAAPPPNSMISAERRMQMMKKKAAAKLNEKRKT